MKLSDLFKRKNKKVVKDIILRVDGIYNKSNVLIITNKKLNSVSFANYDNDEIHMKAPWTLFMTPENAVKLAKTILENVK